MKPLKVWGGLVMGKGSKQIRRIVAAYTKKHACELAGVPYHHFDDYWCETGNKAELEVAKEVGVWDCEKHFSTDPKYYLKVGGSHDRT